MDYTVNTKELKKSVSKEYVCFIDIMGTQNCMRTSFERAANFIMRLHCCVTEVTDSLNKGRRQNLLSLYPIMDGVYLTSSDPELLLSAIRRVFDKLAQIQVHFAEPQKLFIVRGAITYGDITHGKAISVEVCPHLAACANGYNDKLLFGLPMIQAYNAEHTAPPFGIYIHESARNINYLQGRFFYWWNHGTHPQPPLVQALHTQLDSYFDWCEKNRFALKMEPAKIAIYREQLKEYFQ